MKKIKPNQEDIYKRIFNQKRKRGEYRMSYEEFASLANRHRYTPIDELMLGNRPTHKNNVQDDRIFELPHFGAKMDTQKDPLVKGGESHKNTAIR